MPDAEPTVAVTDEPVLDVAGNEVSDSALGWIVFISLHLDEDRYFRVDDLVDDTLLALGYQDRDQRGELGRDGEPHKRAVHATVQQLIEKGLVERDTGPDFPHYRLTDNIVEDIRHVRARIGQFWGFAGSEDAIDTYAELGLLVIVALRIQDSNRASRDDLADKLASLLGDRDGDARSVALTELLSMLKMHNYVDAKRRVNIRPWTSRDKQLISVAWTLNDRAWGGVSLLRQSLRDVFGDNVLPGAPDSSQDPQVTSHDQGVSTPDDLALADTEPQDGQSDEAGEQPDSSRDGIGVAPSSGEPDSFPMPDVEDLAWTLIQVLRTSGNLSVGRAQDGVRDRMHIPLESGILQRAADASESRFEHGLRRARLALQHRAKAVRVQHDVESDEQMLVLRPSGHTISRSKVDDAVRQNEKFIASGASGRKRGSAPTPRTGRNLEQDSDSADVADSDQWAYDHRRWCWLTLEVMRDLSQDVVDAEIPNGTISGALADRLQLSPSARNVPSSRNEQEKEYTARCATMRALLAEVELIERGNKSATWRILGKGEEVSEADLTTLIKAANVGGLPGANGTYRGNDELEAVIAEEGALPNEQVPTKLKDDRPAAMPDLSQHGQSDLPRDASGDRELSDVQLCVATLESLPTEEGEWLQQADLTNAVLARLNLPATYNGGPAPLWVKYDDKRKGMTLLEYRMEHVVRALSIGRSGLIRDGGLDFPDKGDLWFLTARGRNVMRRGDVADQVARMTAEYFDAHDYSNWTDEEWKKQVFDILWEGGQGGGRGFEHLVAELLTAQQDVERADVQGGYLDSMGVDVVAKLQQAPEAQFGTISVGRAAVLLAQCKRHRNQQIGPDAATKLFGFAARLREQAVRGDVLYDVAGGLVAFFGDLTRDATWTFWALRAAWDALSAAEKGDQDRNSQGPKVRLQPDVRWEIWDGQRIFALMREHRIGVDVEDSGEVVVDEKYLRGLLRSGGDGREA